MKKTSRNKISSAIVSLVTCQTLLLAQSDPNAVADQWSMDECTFSPISDHPYFPLHPGHQLVLQGHEEDALFVLEWEVIDETRVFELEIGGTRIEIETAIVRETETEDGELVEISHNYFAQCKETGSVFYFGETVDDFEDGALVGHDGAWLAGEDNNLPGVIMPGQFTVGQSYAQEIAPGVAEDRAINVAAGLSLETAAGTFEDVIQVEEIDPLEPDAEPSSKFYAPGVGLLVDDFLRITDINAKGASQYDPHACTFSPVGNNPYFPLLPGHRLVLQGEEDGAMIQVIWEVLPETREITLELNGEIQTIETAIIRETETEDGELTEISWNFFAHCVETGAVFYFGEDVDDYEDGQVVAHSGAWLAGQDGAIPGVIMPGEFVVGDSYFQEIAPGIAEDFAVNAAEDLTYSTSLGEFDEVILIEESSPLEPEAEPSIKRYAPGLGLIFDDLIELVEATPGPQLNIQSGVLLSWPAVEGEFFLESAPSVDGPWHATLLPIAEFDDSMIAAVPTASGDQLFRLRQFHTQTADPQDTSVVINEFMASNSTTLEDPSGGFDDWIELHNTTNQTVDLSGMYLSDDPQNLARWQIPAGTEIGPGGFLLIWADGDEDQSFGLHTNFRLAAGGETLMLVGSEGNLDALIDSVEYDAVEADQSIGRSQAEPTEFEVLAPSPGQQNP